MKLRQIAQTCVMALLYMLSGACATQPETKAGKGHWATLPAVTGSMIQRRVWVDENGNVSNAPGIGNVSGASASALERAQRPGGVRPPGN